MQASSYLLVMFALMASLLVALWISSSVSRRRNKFSLCDQGWTKCHVCAVQPVHLNSHPRAFVRPKLTPLPFPDILYELLEVQDGEIDCE
jgi:hypothetical protein